MTKLKTIIWILLVVVALITFGLNIGLGIYSLIVQSSDLWLVATFSINPLMSYLMFLLTIFLLK